MNNFSYLHWEFYIDDVDIMVYEKRCGDVIGILNYDGGIEDLQNELNGKLEEDVYQFIDKNIEYL